MALSRARPRAQVARGLSCSVAAAQARDLSRSAHGVDLSSVLLPGLHPSLLMPAALALSLLPLASCVASR